MMLFRVVSAALSIAFISLPAYSSSAGTAPVRSLLELRQDKIVMQEWDLSCGAAALTTLLRYQHGDTVTEKEVALGLIDRDVYIANPELVKMRRGFSLLDLKRYVDSHGYQGSGFGNMTVTDLVNRAPILVPINIFGYNHFVIFRGMLENRVLLADPAWGNRTMTIANFEAAWIDYISIGHVGFIVQAGDAKGPQSPNLLLPEASDFVTLN